MSACPSFYLFGRVHGYIHTMYVEDERHCRGFSALAFGLTFLLPKTGCTPTKETHRVSCCGAPDLYSQYRVLQAKQKHIFFYFFFYYYLPSDNCR